MNVVSKVLLAAALTLSFAAPVLAQQGAPEENTLAERNVYLFMNGKMVTMHAGDATHTMIMANFKPLKNGTMIYVSGGKLYMAEDKKLSDGKMMSTAIFGKDFGIGSER